MHDGNFHNDCPCANRLTYSNGVVMEVSNGENARGCLRDICQRLKQTAGRTNRVPRCFLLKVVCAKGCARSRKMVFLAPKGFVFPTKSLQRLNLSILIWKGGNKHNMEQTFCCHMNSYSVVLMACTGFLRLRL